ncbi:hypothetical protein M0R45_031015 [Rubus argutus]|uniref:Uncharacterized protein n=1 Tax=Rubus argutus TaxID=59490 RepID=A0AAW1WCN1_RUBAR
MQTELGSTPAELRPGLNEGGRWLRMSGSVKGVCRGGKGCWVSRLGFGESDGAAMVVGLVLRSERWWR